MRIERRYTKAGQSAYADIEFRKAKSEIRNPDGSVVYSQDNIDVPTTWSQVATDVLAQKYFRKAGVPRALKKVEENDVPSFLWRSVADEAALESLPKAERFGSERTATLKDKTNFFSHLQSSLSDPKMIQLCAWEYDGINTGLLICVVPHDSPP